jgi:Ig-like domain-containing protein/IPT/TIG domain-containing protein
MNKSARRILFSGMAIVFLLGACAPAPAATQDAASDQQQINEIVTQTLSAQNSQANSGIQPADATAAAQSIQANNEKSIQTSVAATITAIQAQVTQPAATAVQEASTSQANPCDSIPTGPDAPTVESISPRGGFNIGKTIITITGKNFIKGWGHTHFCFGKVEADPSAVSCKSRTECTAITPAGITGDVTVKAFNDTDPISAASGDNTFTYIVLDPNAPVIENIKPQEGTIRGGTEVTVTGDNFILGKQGVDANVTKFYFGSNEAKNVVCASKTQCKMTSPGGMEGFVTVRAVNGSYESQHIPGNDFDGFKYNGIPPYGCGVLTVTPKNLTVFKSEEPFDIKWIVKNTGLNAWPAGLDVKYSAGVDMGDPNVQSIPVVMKPNDTYPITVNAKAPKDPGKYYMTWIVEGQGCEAYVAIVVE